MRGFAGINKKEKKMKNVKVLSIIVIAIALLISGCMFSMDSRLVEKGFQHLQKDELAAAETNFLEALKKNPDNPYAMLNLGVVYQNTNRLTKAAEMYNSVIRRNGTERVGKSTKTGAKGKTLVTLAKENLASL